MIKKFDKDSLALFRNEFKKNVEALEKKFGVSIKIGNIGYSDLSFSTKMVVVLGNSKSTNPTEKARAEKVLQQEFERNKWMVTGLLSEHFGKEFESKGRKYKIVGINTRSRKYPIIVEDIKTGEQNTRFGASILSRIYI